MSVLRLVRDWSNTRRRGAAEADQAEPERAHGTHTPTTRKPAPVLTRWLIDEAKAGRAAIPIGELLAVVAPDDGAALARLAEHRVEISAPAGLDPSSTG